MKKFLSGILLFAVLLFASSIAFAGGGETPTIPSSGGGSGGGGGGIVVSSTPPSYEDFTEIEKYELEQLMLRKVTLMEFYLYKITTEQNSWNADRSFSVNVVKGRYYGTCEGIEPGKYRVDVFARDDSWNLLFTDQVQIEIFPGILSYLYLKLKINPNYGFQLVVKNLPGEFTSDQSYQVTIQYGQNRQENSGWVDQNGDLHVKLYLPIGLTSGQLFIRDKNGNIWSTMASFSIFDAISSDIAVSYEPIDAYGGVLVDVNYEWESKGLLLEKDQDFPDGDWNWPTAIAGQTFKTVAQYNALNVSDEDQEYLTFFIRGENLGDYFSVIRVLINGEFWGWSFYLWPGEDSVTIGNQFMDTVFLRTMSNDSIQLVADVRSDASTQVPLDGLTLQFRARGVNSGVDTLSSEIAGQQIFIAPYNVRIRKGNLWEEQPKISQFSRDTVGYFAVKHVEDGNVVGLKSVDIVSHGSCLLFYQIYDQFGYTFDNNNPFALWPGSQYAFLISIYASESCQLGEFYSFQLTNFKFDGPLGEYTVPKTITYWVEIK